MASYKELLAQRDDLNKQIADARKVEIADAIKQVKALIQEYELTAVDCGFTTKTIDSPPTTTRAPAKPKYITPDGKTWTGRGRAPKEFQALLDAGRDKEEFLIK